jgi:hypothetical protein
MYNYIRNKINQYNSETGTPISGELLKLATPSAVAAGGLLASYLANGLLPGSDVDPATIALGAGVAFGTPSGSLYSKVGKLALGGEIAKTALNDALGTDYQTLGIVPVGFLAGGLANRYGKRWFNPNNIDKGDIPTPQQPSATPEQPYNTNWVSDLEDIISPIARNASSPATRQVSKVTPDAWNMEVTVNTPKNSAPPIVSPGLLAGSNPSATVQKVTDNSIPTPTLSKYGAFYGFTPEQDINLQRNINNLILADKDNLMRVLDPEYSGRDGKALTKFLSQEFPPEVTNKLVFPGQLKGKGQIFEGKEVYNPENMLMHSGYIPSPRVQQSKIVAIGGLTPNTMEKSYLVQNGLMKDGDLFPGVFGMDTTEVVERRLPLGVVRNDSQLDFLNDRLLGAQTVGQNITGEQMQDSLLGQYVNNKYGSGTQSAPYDLNEYLGLRNSLRGKRKIVYDDKLVAYTPTSN